MIIDCESCTVRGAACTDCVVTFLTIPVRAGTSGTAAPLVPGPHAPRAVCGAETDAGLGPDADAYPPDLDEAERRAIAVLASCGLVPPLRLERAV